MAWNARPKRIAGKPPTRSKFPRGGRPRPRREPLKRCGISTLQQLRDTPAAAQGRCGSADRRARASRRSLVEAAGRVAEQGILQQKCRRASSSRRVTAAGGAGLDRRLFAFPASHASVVKAILAADRGASRPRLPLGRFEKAPPRHLPARRRRATLPTFPSYHQPLRAPWTSRRRPARWVPSPRSSRASCGWPGRTPEPLPATLAGSVLQLRAAGLRGAPAYDHGGAGRDGVAALHDARRLVPLSRVTGVVGCPRSRLVY